MQKNKIHDTRVDENTQTVTTHCILDTWVSDAQQGCTVRTNEVSVPEGRKKE
jgi:hypothetical protein